jgi:hypothetical protein
VLDQAIGTAGTAMEEERNGPASSGLDQGSANSIKRPIKGTATTGDNHQRGGLIAEGITSGARQGGGLEIKDLGHWLPAKQQRTKLRSAPQWDGIGGGNPAPGGASWWS